MFQGNEVALNSTSTNYGKVHSSYLISMDIKRSRIYVLRYYQKTIRLLGIRANESRHAAFLRPFFFCFILWRQRKCQNVPERFALALNALYSTFFVKRCKLKAARNYDQKSLEFLYEGLFLVKIILKMKNSSVLIVCNQC